MGNFEEVGCGKGWRYRNVGENRERLLDGRKLKQAVPEAEMFEPRDQGQKARD